MKTNQDGINLIKNFEGCRLIAYRCPAGILTIGYGHTGNVRAGQRITQAEAETFLKIDLEKYENAINTLVKVPLSQNQFNALVSFVFNVGIGAFQSSTLLKLLNQKQYKLASEQFTRWVYANKKVVEGLKTRRQKEKELFLK